MRERTTIGGTVYETVGSSTSNLLLKCNGTARIQWGNTLIDLIKDGKLATSKQNKSEVFSGLIVMYSGTNVPEGWAICDGGTYKYKGNNYNTPNLTSLFIKDNEHSNEYQLIYIMKL